MVDEIKSYKTNLYQFCHIFCNVDKTVENIFSILSIVRLKKSENKIKIQNIQK